MACPYYALYLPIGVQYIVPSPFATAFKYSRYDARGPVAPRNISLLTGLKKAVTAHVSGVAGSTELHGVDEMSWEDPSLPKQEAHARQTRSRWRSRDVSTTEVE